MGSLCVLLLQREFPASTAPKEEEIELLLLQDHPERLNLPRGTRNNKRERNLAPHSNFTTSWGYAHLLYSRVQTKRGPGKVHSSSINLRGDFNKRRRKKKDSSFWKCFKGEGSALSDVSTPAPASKEVSRYQATKSVEEPVGRGDDPSKGEAKASLATRESSKRATSMVERKRISVCGNAIVALPKSPAPTFMLATKSQLQLAKS
ncbi:conserved hypothetical protein [Ricinus communis]|uniref:Uncharacterized protein n=1 Tax=Ricinus communis TaxID=3988 RepID=B9S1U9_RICCO|nr:conserved hypothetical protein [Ricinus communis]